MRALNCCCPLWEYQNKKNPVWYDTKWGFNWMIKCWIFHNYHSKQQKEMKQHTTTTKIEISPISNCHIERTKMETTLVAIHWISRKTGLPFSHIWQTFYLYIFFSACVHYVSFISRSKRDKKKHCWNRFVAK